MSNRRDHRFHDRPFAKLARVTKAAVDGDAVFGLPHRALSKKIQPPNKDYIQFIRLKNFPDWLSVLKLSVLKLSVLKLLTTLLPKISMLS